MTKILTVSRKSHHPIETLFSIGGLACNVLTMLVSIINNKNISLNLKNLKIKIEIYIIKSAFNGKL